MMQNGRKRIVLDFLIVISVAAGTWYSTVLIAFLGFVYITRWWEVVVAALFVDLLYGGTMDICLDHLGVWCSTTLVTAILYVVAETLRTMVRTR